MPKLRCVRYKDEFSAGGSSYRDLEIGLEHQVVGCNSTVFGSSRPGDYVIIVANRGSKLYFIPGMLLERVVSCDLWASEGGHHWTHNFTYRPLLGNLHEITPVLKERIKILCASRFIDPTYFFHSRFCGERFLPVLQELIAEIKSATA